MSTLREYQTKAVDQIEAAINAKQAPLYVLPTGGGKTVVATAIIERAAQAGQRVLVLTHRREILKQTSYKVSGSNLDHGLIQAGLNADPEHPIQIASIQTLHVRCMRSDKMSLPAANLIIVDEAHHIAARTWDAIFSAYPSAARIGLTATPCRGDGRGLGNYFTTIVEGPQIPDLIGEKHLVPTVYYAPADPDLRDVETRKGDYVISQLADRMNRDDLVGDIVTHWHKHGERRKTLVFCVDVAHSVHVKNEFVNAGVRAEHLDGKTPKPERDAILARLASGETEVVSNCMVLTEGFDLPAIGCIVLARPTKQLGLFRQMAGRGLRPAPGKPNLVLIDHSGAVYRHGLLEDRIEWTLDVTQRAQNLTHASRGIAQTRKLVDCSQCGAVRTAGEACTHCGFLPKPRADAILFRDGELARVGAEKTFDPGEKIRWHRMLTAIQQERDHKPGWVGHKFKDKFGHWPRGRVEPLDPSPEVRSWVRSRNIAYAKSRERATA